MNAQMETSGMDTMSDEIQQLACPACHNDDTVSWTPKTIILAKIFSLGLFPLVFPIKQVRHQCKCCNHEWNHWY